MLINLKSPSLNKLIAVK